MIAILLAATLQFGTVKSSVATIDVDHPKLEEVLILRPAGGIRRRPPTIGQLSARHPSPATNRGVVRLMGTFAKERHVSRAENVPFDRK